MNLSLEVKNYIQSYNKALKKELSYIESKNWVMQESFYKREKLHDRQRLITDRTLKKLKHFANISEEFRNYPSVKSFVELLVKFMTIYIERYDQCDKLYDWTKFEEKYPHYEIKTIENMIDKEIEFQSKVLNNVATFSKELKALNLDDQSTSIEIPIYADIPAPFLLRKKFESMFPEISIYRQHKYGKEQKNKG